MHLRTALLLGFTLWFSGCSPSHDTTSGDDASFERREAGKADARTDVSRKRSDAGHDAVAPEDAQNGLPDVLLDANVTPDAPAPPCGSVPGHRGLTHRSVVVDGVVRTYLVYLPASTDTTQPMPFVFVFHGFTMSGAEMETITRYTDIADAEGIGVAFPDGEGGPHTLSAPWNVRGPNQTVCGDGDLVSGSGNDFGFIDAMKAAVSDNQCLDTAHLFSTGFSMGGYFTHHIACYRSDMRAVAPHSGGTLADLSVCTTGHVPMILFHGRADDVIDDACDDPTVAPDVGFPPSAKLWAAKNGCKPTFTTVATDGDGGTGSGAGQCYLYDGCPADGQVEVCTFDGMPHCWAGGNAGDPADADTNACPAYARATDLQWAFFKKYAW